MYIYIPLPSPIRFPPSQAWAQAPLRAAPVPMAAAALTLDSRASPTSPSAGGRYN